jgi:CubicO group peptidase (beta-lactamase class C family)
VSRSLDLIGDWPATGAAGWARSGEQELAGPVERPFPWASVTKVLSALTVWVAVEEGTVAWQDEAGPPGSTLAHLLAHASGLAPDTDLVLAPPGVRRIYSNRGFEIAADHVERAADTPFGEYAREAVLEPLRMARTTLAGSPASGAAGPLVDLLRLAVELSAPSLLSRGTLDLTTSVAFAGLAGVLPGFGWFEKNDWGLGVEIRARKYPHWTGASNSPATFGHFGRSGSFLWVDPVAGVVLASLADRPFGPWAARAWPALSDAVLDEVAGRPEQAQAGRPVRTPRPGPPP